MASEASTASTRNFGRHSFEQAEQSNTFHFAILANPVTDVYCENGFDDKAKFVISSKIAEYDCALHLTDDRVGELTQRARDTLRHLQDRNYLSLHWLGPPLREPAEVTKPPGMGRAPRLGRFRKSHEARYKTWEALTWLYMRLAESKGKHVWMRDLNRLQEENYLVHDMAKTMQAPWGSQSRPVPTQPPASCDLSSGRNWAQWGPQVQDLIVLWFMTTTITTVRCIPKGWDERWGRTSYWGWSMLGHAVVKKLTTMLTEPRREGRYFSSIRELLHEPAQPSASRPDSRVSRQRELAHADSDLEEKQFPDPGRSLRSEVRRAVSLERRSEFGQYCFEMAHLTNRYFAIIANPKTDVHPYGRFIMEEEHMTRGNCENYTRILNSHGRHLDIREDGSNVDEFLEWARKALSALEDQGYVNLTWHGPPAKSPAEDTRPAVVSVAPDPVAYHRTYDKTADYDVWAALTWLYMDLAGPRGQEEWLEPYHERAQHAGPAAMQHIMQTPFTRKGDSPGDEPLVRPRSCDLSHGKDWKKWGRKRMDLIVLFFMIQTISAVWEREEHYDVQRGHWVIGPYWKVLGLKVIRMLKRSFGELAPRTLKQVASESLDRIREPSNLLRGSRFRSRGRPEGEGSEKAVMAEAEADGEEAVVWAEDLELGEPLPRYERNEAGGTSGGGGLEWEWECELDDPSPAYRP